jgi:hypothetical protein
MKKLKETFIDLTLYVGTNLNIYMKNLKQTFIDLTLYVGDIILIVNDPKGLSNPYLNPILKLT